MRSGRNNSDRGACVGNECALAAARGRPHHSAGAPKAPFQPWRQQPRRPRPLRHAARRAGRPPTARPPRRHLASWCGVAEWWHRVVAFEGVDTTHTAQHAPHAPHAPVRQSVQSVRPLSHTPHHSLRLSLASISVLNPPLWMASQSSCARCGCGWACGWVCACGCVISVMAAGERGACTQHIQTNQPTNQPASPVASGLTS